MCNMRIIIVKGVMFMIGKETEGETAVSLNDVKRILDDRKKGKELTYEQQLAYEHAKRFTPLEKGKEDKLRKALAEFGLSDRSVIKIIDILPKSAMTLRQILVHENKTFDDAEVVKILAAVKENS
jgi:DNA-directed RNA polymerase subunit F